MPLHTSFSLISNRVGQSFPWYSTLHDLPSFSKTQRLFQKTSNGEKLEQKHRPAIGHFKPKFVFGSPLRPPFPCNFPRTPSRPKNRHQFLTDNCFFLVSHLMYTYIFRCRMWKTWMLSMLCNHSLACIKIIL